MEGATPETDARTYIPSIGASTVPSEFARKLERERASAIRKIQRQAERIRQLEGATNHAGGTPLSIALSDMIKRFIFERVSENIITKPWMKACYRDSQTREIVMAAWPLNYAIQLAWMLNLAWQRYRHRESWIDRMIASEARLKIIQLERERDEKQEIIRRSCVDWAEDHTHLQNLCREVGATEHEVEGDSYGVPSISDLADCLKKLLVCQRDKWEETARVYCQNSDYHREMREKAERERDEAIAARKASAADWRNQLDQMGKCVSSAKRMAALAVKERTEMLEALMKIEDVFVDGEDTYEGWRAMGNIARAALEGKV
jgi:hypothetical protein